MSNLLSANTRRVYSAILVCSICFLGSQRSEAGSILREVWSGIGGNAVNDLRAAPGYPNSPTSTNLVEDFFEAPTDVDDSYGQRMHGYIIPPVSGNYTFWIASDDNSELWLSTDQTQTNQKKIASVAAWTSPREWTKEAGQKSTAQNLQANKPYYIAALQKEGAGGDNLAVRWLRPDSVDEGPIPAKYLLPFGTSFVAPIITKEPPDLTVIEGQIGTFSVEVDPSSPATPQWFRNSAAVTGTQSLSLPVGPVTFADANSTFQVVLTNFMGSTTSRVATLNIAADITPPSLTNVMNAGLTRIRLSFDEPIESASGTTAANYAVSGGIQVSGAEMSADGKLITLTVTPALVAGTDYVVTVKSLQDRASQPNTIAANTQVSFTALEYTPVAIGTPASGALLTVENGFDIQGSGADIGGTKDQFAFGYQERTGNFDVRVRVADLKITDPYVKAGLMARENLQDTGRFAAMLASSAELGCFFEYRSTSAGAATIPGPNIKFPASFPWVWLRLQRNGNDFNGYGSFDGKSWQLLGTINMTLPAQVFFGMAVTSDNAKSTTTAKFREIGAVQNATTFTYVPKREPLGPSNRRTGVVFSEIMYHPADRSDGKNLEFVEIYNGEPFFVNLTGWRISGGIDYSFPDGFQMQAGQFVVIAADPEALAAVYGIQGVLGPYTGQLSNKKERLKLLSQAGAVRADLTYDSEGSWPASADGAGHSLVMLKPSYGEEDPRAWGPSQLVGGSPGQDDPVVPHPWAGVLINEFLANTATPADDFIELYNAGNGSVDLSGCFLSDSPATNKFRIQDGTVVSARGWISFNGTQLGFGVGSAGETLYLVAADGSRVLDAVRYGPQERGVSSGRSPDGGPVFRRLAAVTPGKANAAWRQEDVIINEIMYKPVTQNDDDQFVELYNQSKKAIDLSGWRFADGISFAFPSGASIPAGGYIVVTRNLQRMLANYSQLSAANTFGNFNGRLSGGGDHVALAKPVELVTTNTAGAFQTNVVYVTTSDVSYLAGGRWPESANEEGSSLELIDPHADPLQASNWRGSDESQKSQWKTFEVTDTLSNANQAYQANKVYIISMGSSGGEYLVDDIEVFRPGAANLVTNPGFESGQTGWTPYGNHITSKVENSGAVSGASCLHIQASGQGDEANNSVRGALSTALTASQTVTLRVKARWLSGWPEMLMRIRGNGIELPIVLPLPPNLGSPGLPNSTAVSNAGPAISEVTHYPPAPISNQSVLVTARVADPDGVASPRLVYRLDPSTTTTTIEMRDDGTGGDLLAGDGIYSAAITGRAAGTLVAFHVEAQDDASPSASASFPDNAPTRECLIRWGDPLPFGSMGHYHLWSTAASDRDLTSHPGLDNKFRDCTLVYNNTRVIYNSGYRNKGSPYHSGVGSYTGKFPEDDLLMGSDDHIYRATGNGGAESTAMADDMALWIASQMGIPYLHSHYFRLFKNGTPHNNVDYDIEYPNRVIAKDWFGGGGLDDTLYKIAVWFEYDDSNGNGTGSTVGATFDKKPSTAPPYKLGAYRWNWQPHPGGRTVNDYSLIFNMISAANASDKVTQLLNLADMEEWMRVYAFDRVIGNWDSWSYNVGQNMYLYTPLGHRARIIPWDIDFVLGLGDAATANNLFSAPQDGRIGALFTVPTYKRMLWRAYQDAVNGPLRQEVSDPQFDARRAALLKNNVTGTTAPTSLKSYVAQRRNYLQTQARAADATSFVLTTRDSTSANPTVTLTGTAPFAIATIEVNGVPYPITWTTATAWSIKVPLGAPANVLQVIGKDLRGNVYPGASAKVTINYTGSVPQPQDWVVINEIMYNAPIKNAEFIELFNRHPSFPFDLSGYKLSGASFTFAPGTLIQPNGYLVVAKDSAAFASAYGATIPLAGQYSGKLQHDGETIRIVKPGATQAEDVTIDEVRYENALPWQPEADGLGPSLQLIDATQDNWRQGNWAVTSTNDVNRATPGKANSTRNLIDSFPPLWINEIVPNNQAGAVDNNGQHEPWIELYNSGSTTLDLSAYYLSSDGLNLTQWAFPAGSTLGPGQFLVVWADGQAGQTIPSALHTNFRLDPTNGLITLSRTQLGAAAVMDYIRYAVTSPDRGYGCIPDGDPRKRRLLFFPTPGEPNNPAVLNVPVFLNEWMADNQSFIVDPVTGGFEDWFEIYNGGTALVDLSGYYLSDDPLNPTQFLIPNGTTIAPGDYRLFWATGDASVNEPGRDVHTSFKMSAGGGQLILAASDGTEIDSVTFGAQAADLSQGRFPDGADAPYFLFSHPTPGAANVGDFANQLPIVSAILDQSISEGQTLGFKVEASDPDNPPQTLTYALLNPPPGATIDAATGQFSWTPSETQGPGVFSVTVRVTDNGTPALTASRSFKVSVSEVNQAPVLDPVPDTTIGEGSLLFFQATASDADAPAQALTFSLAPGAPDGAGIDPQSGQFNWIPTEQQGPGDYDITVRVADSLGASATQTFHVRVLEVDNPPVITQVVGRTINELTQFQVQVSAHDPDSPPVALVYSLENAPAGAVIDPNTGVFTWIPSEEQGPLDYPITVKVTQVSNGLSGTMTFVIGVDEVNTAPTLAPIADYTVQGGETISFAAKAADSDIPAQHLSFSAAADLPKGATLDPASGVFTWQVPNDPPNGVNTITIRVTDDDTSPLSAEQTFHIIVQAKPLVVINEIMHKPAAANAEFVELANFSSINPVDLSGWRLQGYDFVFPAGTTLPANSFLCVARDLNAFRGAYGTSPAAVGNASISIEPGDGTIRLVKPGAPGFPDQVMDEVHFALQAPWPAAAGSAGASLQLIDWHQDRRRVANWAASVGSVTNAPVEVISMDKLWSYYQDAAYPGDNWNQPAFQDSSWSTGKALLYVEDAALPAPKNTPLILGQTSYYFRAHFTFSGAVEGAQLQISTIVDDGAVVYLNGQRVYAIGMPDPPITQSTLATRTVGDAVLEGPALVPALGLKQGDNVIAVEVHQRAATGSSDIVMGVSAQVISVSAKSFTPGAPNSVAAALPEFANVWINEIEPVNTTGLTDNTGAHEPWIELYNAGLQPLALDDWSMTDAYDNLGQWIFPAGTIIPARGYLLVWADGESAQSVSDQPHANFRLKSTGGSVALARPQQGVRAVFDYLDYAGVPDNQSFGSSADGTPEPRQIFTIPTPGSANHRLNPDQPRITVTLDESGNIHLTWPTQTGLRYRVQATAALSNPDWQPVLDLIADGTPLRFDDSGAQGERYYRLLVE